MNTIIIGMIIISTVISTVVNFAKPAYEQFAWKRAVTVNIGLSFLLGIASAFAVAPYSGIELSVWASILVWLALGTGSTVFYDIWKLIQNLGSTKKDNVVEKVEEKTPTICSDLSPEEEESNKTWESLSDKKKINDWSNANRD